jgi:DNA-3-methyladenine glycosylase I
LRKRENFRRAFGHFDPEALARFGRREVARLMSDAGIIRNRAKIEGAIANAKAYLEVLEEGRSFDAFLWQFTGYETLRRKRIVRSSIPTSTRESDAMAKELKRRGFKFVGTTVCYSHMQATGMVNDHLDRCFRAAELIG